MTPFLVPLKIKLSVNGFEEFWSVPHRDIIGDVWPLKLRYGSKFTTPSISLNV